MSKMRHHRYSREERIQLIKNCMSEREEQNKKLLTIRPSLTAEEIFFADKRIESNKIMIEGCEADLERYRLEEVEKEVLKKARIE